MQTRGVTVPAKPCNLCPRQILHNLLPHGQSVCHAFYSSTWLPLFPFSESVCIDTSFLSYRIFEAAAYFIQHVSHCDASSVTHLVRSDTEVDVLAITHGEAKSFDRTKCSVTIRLLDMVSVVLKSSEPHYLPSSLLSLQLWQLIVACVLHPASLGFDFHTTEVSDGLAKNLIELLGILQQSLPSSKMAELNSELRKAVSSTHIVVFSNLQDTLKNDKVTLKQKQFLQGLEILHRCGVLSQIVKV
jgi:hypothetical protein